MYRCVSCGREVEVTLDKARKIQCPYCGYRILKKERPKLTKMVKAR